MPNYSFVIDSTYNPFTMQEMVAPLAMYKDAFDKSEAAFEDLTDKADKFKYLSMTLPEGSKGRQIYENYSNELNKQAEDLARNGLSVNNRMALRNLRRRYQGEIGRLDLADQALQEEKKLRRQMNAKDSSMLYAEDNLSIDNFLDGATPNLYNISGTELYTRGAAAGKAASSRVYSAGDEGSTLNGYYRKWTERYGYSKESMDAFRANASAIPELQQAAENILAERGALDNLSGANLERARQSVLNGIIDGAVYQEKVNPVRDEGKLSAAQEAQLNIQREQMAKNAAMNGLTWNKSTNSWDYDIKKDPSAQRAAKIAEIKAQNGGGSGGSAGYDNRNKQAIAVGSNGSVKIADNDGKLFGINISDLPVQTVSWTDIINKDGSIKDENLASALKNSSIYGYEVYKIPKGTELDGSGWIWDDSTDEDYYILLPRDSKKDDYNSSNTPDTNWSNDIPKQ